MPKTPFKLDYLHVAIIAFVVWTTGMATVYYGLMPDYSPAAVEELRPPVLMEAMIPTFAFNCYKGDESLVGSNLECENEMLLKRHRMLFYTKKIKLFLFIYFVVPLLLWILYVGKPVAFDFIHRFVEEPPDD